MNRIPADETTWAFEVRPTCHRCERLAVVFDDDRRPLCPRHATIFMMDWDRESDADD